MVLISREAVLDKIDELRTMLDYPYDDAIEHAEELKDYVNGLPASDNWIPCSKSMPEDFLTYNRNTSYPVINVLVTTENGKVTKLQRIGDKGYDEKHELTWRWGRIHGGIKAWQPLPEGYKEDK
jgi:hypothetical protein